MKPMTYEAVPEGLPVVATATGHDDGGMPVQALVMQSRGGHVYYVSVWATEPEEYRGSWKTRRRERVDKMLATLREHGFTVDEYPEVLRWRAWAGGSEDEHVTCVTYETPVGRECEPKNSRAVRIQHVTHEEAVRMMRGGDDS